MKRRGQDSLNSWLISLVCCSIFLLLGGVYRLKGILFVETIARFNVTREKASFPYMFSGFTRTIIGPLVGYLGHKFDVQYVAIFGALLAASGIGLCYVAETIDVVTLFFGVLYGVGFGLSYLLLPVSINKHFQNYRATASGISFSGVGLGSFIYSPLTIMLLKNYGLSGTFLIIGAIALNSVPASLLLRKLDFEASYTKLNRKQIASTAKKRNIYTIDTDSRISSSCQNVEFGVTSKTSDIDSAGRNSLVAHKDKKISAVLANSMNVKYFSASYQGASCSGESFQESDVLPDKLNDNQISDTDVRKDKDISLLKLFSVLVDPIFILTTISHGIYVFTLDTVIITIIDFSRDIQIGDFAGKYIMMVISAGDFAGRLCVGWITDRGYMSLLTFLASCFILEGIATAAIAFSNGFGTLITILTIFCISKCGLTVIFAVVIGKYIDQDRQTIAMASHQILIAPLVLAISPLIGYFRDTLGSYTWLFYFTGILSIACGIVWILVSYKIKRQKKRQISYGGKD